jgi:hypothetical protein
VWVVEPRQRQRGLHARAHRRDLEVARTERGSRVAATTLRDVLAEALPQVLGGLQGPNVEDVDVADFPALVRSLASQDVHLDAPPAVLARPLLVDRYRVIQVVMNLVGNAIKHAPGGSRSARTIAVTASSWRSSTTAPDPATPQRRRLRALSSGGAQARGRATRVRPRARGRRAAGPGARRYHRRGRRRRWRRYGADRLAPLGRQRPTPLLGSAEHVSVTLPGDCLSRSLALSSGGFAGAGGLAGFLAALDLFFGVHPVTAIAHCTSVSAGSIVSSFMAAGISPLDLVKSLAGDDDRPNLGPRPHCRARRARPRRPGRPPPGRDRPAPLGRAVRRWHHRQHPRQPRAARRHTLLGSATPPRDHLL